ncbi:MAG: hypothetical protein FWB85_06520, partial [Chitinispirillia bacterium]|nr:hypothetical protein [Chitinispirillia bacterium]
PPPPPYVSLCNTISHNNFLLTILAIRYPILEVKPTYIRQHLSLSVIHSAYPGTRGEMADINIPYHIYKVKEQKWLTKTGLLQE